VYFPKKSYKVRVVKEDFAVKENNVPAGLPAHETVYRALRELILFGELTPGSAVTIQGLVDTLGAGMTPVREAIRRLTAEGALVFQGNRRVCVPVLTQANLDELAYARAAIERQLVYLAAKKHNSCRYCDTAQHRYCTGSINRTWGCGCISAP
jgi:DNA-binding GntR family transcriptional regulator